MRAVDFHDPDRGFWARVRKTDVCWYWDGPRYPGRAYYGLTPRTWPGGRYAHRCSWILHNGQIPAGMNVLHRCDNYPCVRPEHLFLGTQRDNMCDAARKGRLRNGGRSGERNCNSKLDGADVRLMRGLWRTGLLNKVQLGIAFGVTPASACTIVNGKTWAEG